MKYGCNACGAYVEAGGGHDCYRQSPTMTALTWTRERPTRSGFYWLRRPSTIEVVSFDGLSAKRLGREGSWFAAELTNCEWAGPLVAPND